MFQEGGNTAAEEWERTALSTRSEVFPRKLKVEGKGVFL